MKTIIQDGLVLLKDGDGYRIEKRDIVINGNIIEKITPQLSKRDMWDADDSVNAFGKLVMPGLINAHTHAYMSLFRNSADDMDFPEWLDKVDQIEKQMTEEDVYWGTMLSAIEMIKSGTTCFVDMTIKSARPGAIEGPEGAAASAANDSGIRAFISRGLSGVSDSEESLMKYGQAIDEMETFADNGRVKFLHGPHAPYTCMPDYLKKLTNSAKERGIGQTIHLSESEFEMKEIAEKYGKTPIQHVADLGVFDVPTIAAHCVYATEDDLKLMKEKGVSVAINPKSNMKLGNGFAPIEKILESGVNLCIGTDGCASNNSQNMFQEMNAAALCYKGATKKTRCFNAVDILKAATEGGAKAIGMEGKLGIIAEGAIADIIILNMYEPQLFPTNDIISSLVYSAKGSEVCTVFVDGVMIMNDNVIYSVTPGRAFTECEKIADRLGLIKY